MASKAVALTSDVLRARDLHLKPLDKVKEFFEALAALREATDETPEGNTRYNVFTDPF